MTRIQHIRRLTAVLAGVACALLASAALAAPSFAMVPPLTYLPSRRPVSPPPLSRAACPDGRSP